MEVDATREPWRPSTRHENDHLGVAEVAALPPVVLSSGMVQPFAAATSEIDAIGTEPRECVGVEEIWATKAPRTMARQETTKASFQPCDFDTSRM